MPKVLISDKLSPQAVDIFKQRGVEVDLKTGLTEEELIKIIGEYDGLAIRSATKVTPAVLAAAHKLKVVGRAGIGVDNVDVKAATARGVVVMNTPFGNSVTTAEHAISLMMSLARDIPAASASTHAGKWEKNKFMGVELAGKTLGLIGCGNIGSIVADRAQGLKMKVISYDPFLSAERASALNVEKVELDELLKRADFISLHTPMTDATRNLLNAERLAKCKKGVRIINCARGGLIVEADLKAAVAPLTLARLQKGPGMDGWDVSDSYGVLENLDQADEFVAAVSDHDGVEVAFVVTDDDSAFQMVCRELPSEVVPVRLYESYLQNFEINTGRSL